MTKAVKDDNNGSFVDSSAHVPVGSTPDVFTAPNRAADSASDQPVEYQLAGTVASNINTYEQYSYCLLYTSDVYKRQVVTAVPAALLLFGHRHLDRAVRQ